MGRRLTKSLSFVVLSFFICLNHVKADEFIKIAVIFAKTGIASGGNLRHLQGVRFAADQINQKGGVLGKKIKLLEFDNRSSAIQSQKAARKAVQEDVLAVIGASWSSHSLAMAPVLQKAGIPMISPDSTNPEVTLKGNYIFRISFIDPFQGKVLAKFVQSEFNAKTAGIFSDITSTYSIGLAETFRKNFEQDGGKILFELEYKPTKREFGEFLEKVKEIEPDVLFIPSHDEGGFIVKQAQQSGISAIMVGGDGWGDQNFYTNGGIELKQGYYTTYWSKELDTPETRKFIEQYQKYYDVDPGAATSYDAIILLVNAIQRANSFDRTKIRDSLAATRNFQGVTGKITFDKNGDPEKPAVIMKIVNGISIYYKTVSEN